MSRILLCVPLAASLFVASGANAVTNLVSNPGFLDVDMMGDYGDAWGSFGAAGFNAFFGTGNPHASLFGDDAFNEGGVFQQSVAGAAGVTYQFDIINVRLESNWDADLSFGLEYYAADDATKLGETIVPIDTATRLANGTIDFNVFSMQGTSVTGTEFVRPVVSFNNVNPGYIAGVTTQANAFVFTSFLSEAPGVGDEFLKNPGFEDEDTQGDVGDYWRSYGAAGFDDFFGGNGHASFFSDAPGNFGGIWQQSILGTEGATYEFSLTDVRIEDNFDANLSFGLEYFGDDDFTKIGETVVSIDTNTGTVDGNSFTMTGTAVAGTKYVRPIVFYDNVLSTATELENVYIFAATFTELGAGLAGDYNNDGIVDAADYTVWRNHLGETDESNINNNGNGDGVDEGDYTLWKQQYGEPMSPGTGGLTTNAVPEPGTLALLAGGVLMIGATRRRRRADRARD